MESVRKLLPRGCAGICTGSRSYANRAAARSLMRNLAEVCLQAGPRAVENNETPFTNVCRKGEVLTIPSDT